MAEPSVLSPTDPVEAAYQEGRRAGLAMAALAVGAVAFLNLLSAEKSILAIVLAALALKGARGAARQQGWLAIALAIVQITLVVIVLALFHDKLIQLLHILQKLS